MDRTKGEILQGTLDLMVLKVLEGMGPMHGYGIARRLEQVSENLLEMNQGTLYPALLRLQQRGWISSRWGASENNRRARFYSLTKAGRKQLATEEESWERTSGADGARARGIVRPLCRCCGAGVPPAVAGVSGPRKNSRAGLPALPRAGRPHHTR